MLSRIGFQVACGCLNKNVAQRFRWYKLSSLDSAMLILSLSVTEKGSHNI